MKNLIGTLLIGLAAEGLNLAQAAIKTETVEYKDGDAVLEGYLVYPASLSGYGEASDNAIEGKLPAVLIVHEWTGLGRYVRNRAEQIAAFQKEMRDAKVDWQMIFYGNAVHSFTNQEAGDNPSKGTAYNKEADMRSWEAMKAFFKEIFS